MVRDLIKQAIQHRGSQEKLAGACGVKQPSISDALKSDRVSAELAVAIHHATGGIVPAWKLRPDLWSRASVIPSSVDRDIKGPVVKRAKPSPKLRMRPTKVGNGGGVSTAAGSR